MKPPKTKTIILVRHGKSSWEHNVTDRERPLKPRGVNDAKLVAEHYMTSNNIPKHIYSSPANRALSTCEIFMNTFGLPKASIVVNENLYDFNGEMVMDFIRNLPETQNEIMIFGHNYALTSIANLLGTTYVNNLPTSGLVKFSIERESWEKIGQGETKLIIIPKDLK